VSTYEEVMIPKSGDWAEHVQGLDPRQVTRVELGESSLSPRGVIWLDLRGVEIGPFPVENYTFKRASISVEDLQSRGIDEARS